MGFFGDMSRALNLVIANTDIGTAIKAPYAIYFVDNETNVYADGKVVYSEKEINFYLYHKKEDITSEIGVEGYLIKKGISFEKENAWIIEDQLIETQYIIHFKKGKEL